MKKLFFILMFIPLVATQALAWGQTGHRVVGLVAEQLLSKKVRKKVAVVLQQNSLAEVSDWMDNIRSEKKYDHTTDWHWVTIPDGMQYENTQKNPNGDLVMKVEELVAALKTGKLPREQEEEYLKYLVHLVGDLHQPLHVGGKDDQGGNRVRVQWFGESSNLHRVWDSDMIEGKQLSFTELASFLGPVNQAQIKAWQSGSIRDWAQGMMVYRPQVYNIPEDGKLGYVYSYENFGTVQALLLQAGIRLAGLLNQIYG